MDRARRLRVLAIALSAAAAVASAQPQLYYRTLVNAASLSPAGLPAGPIARGAVFTFSGAGIGPANAPAPSDPPAATLGGVSISVTQGTTTVASIPLAVSPTSVTAIMPMNAPLGAVALRLRYNNFNSNPMPVQVVASQFGIFTANGFGNGPANAQLVADDGTTQPLTLQTPAMPGQIVTITGTGLGGVAPSAISVFVAGLAASGIQTMPVQGSPGQDQVQFTVPADAPSGCWVPLYLKTGPAAAISNFASIAISADGSPCQEPNNLSSLALINGGNAANFAAARITMRHDAAVATPVDAVSEFLGGYTANEQVGPNNFNPLFSLPPAGTCTVYATTGELRNDIAAIVPGVTPPTGMALDAGKAMLVAASGATSTATNSTVFPGISSVQVGASVPSVKTLHNQTALDSGTITLQVPGGADIGATSVDAPAPPRFTWTNRDQTLAITRSKGLTISWNGGDPAATAFIVGYSFDMPTNSGAVFQCLAVGTDSSFTVPPDVLSSVPASRARAIQSRGVIWVGQWNLASPAALSGPGVDFGALIPLFVSGKTVTFQ